MSRHAISGLGKDDSEPGTQCGALCWRKHRGHVQVLLITSRETGRWVLPKGWPQSDMTAAGSAAAEAWEEAGVEGSVCEAPLGLYSYDKVLKPGLLQPCIVTVFAMRVARLRAKFPEQHERRRKWFDAARAARKVAEPELRVMLACVAADPGLVDVATKA
jgi:8-oxo-dGTP pyrophosphatase MutT (NUDIX family)